MLRGASATLCVAVDSQGNVVTSTDPAGGAAKWHVVNIVSGNLTSVSCTATPAVLCAVAGGGGNPILSTNPTGGASAWKSVDLGSSSFGYVSCPTSSFCIGTEVQTSSGNANAFGEVVTSTNPTGGASDWTAAVADPDHTLYGVSCAATSLCVAYDGAGDVVTSTDPTGGASAWTVAAADYSGEIILGVSCQSAGECVAVDDAGDVVPSTSPTGGGDAWDVTSVDGGGGATESVSCVSGPQCVAVDDAGDVISTTDPGGLASAWNLANVDGTNALLDISCAGLTQCVAVDSAGNVVTSTAPTGGVSAWKVANVDDTTSITGVSCPTTSLCVAVDADGDVLVSTSPTGGAAAWQREPLGANVSFVSVSCASAGLCVAVDSNGDVATSTDPGGGAGAWTIASVNAGVAFNGVSCAPATTICVIAADNGTLVTSTDPAAGAAAWSATTRFSPEYSMESVSCPLAELCVAVGDDGNVEVSTDPIGGTGDWTLGSADMLGPNNGRTMVGVSCTSALCVALDYDGHELAGTPPAMPSAHVVEVTLSGSGEGYVTSAEISCPDSCAWEYSDGSGLILTAQPSPGFQFLGWSGGCTGTGSCSLTVNADTAVAADFEPLTYALTVSDAGGGTVSGPGISCPGVCDEYFTYGTAVTLSATPAAGWRFADWLAAGPGGGPCPGTGSCTIAMDGPQSVAANFYPTGNAAPGAPSGGAPARPTLSIIGSGTVYDAGGDVAGSCAAEGPCTAPLAYTGTTFTAMPASGWRFSGWGGICSGTGTCSVADNADGALSATFTQLPGVSIATKRPGTPAIKTATIADGTASFKFAKPSGGVTLRCALVRRVSGRHAKQPAPDYAFCGITKTYTHLRAGTYTLYLKALSGGVASAVTTRTFRVGAK